MNEKGFLERRFREWLQTHKKAANAVGHNAYLEMILRDAFILGVATEPPRSPAGYVAMPRELTAENGAKALLIGEFFEELVIQCSECSNIDIGVQDNCHICDGRGEYSQTVPVQWSTIKDIYAMAVKHLAT